MPAFAAMMYPVNRQRFEGSGIDCPREIVFKCLVFCSPCSNLQKAILLSFWENWHGPFRKRDIWLCAVIHTDKLKCLLVRQSSVWPSNPNPGFLTSISNKYRHNLLWGFRIMNRVGISRTLCRIEDGGKGSPSYVTRQTPHSWWTCELPCLIFNCLL